MGGRVRNFTVRAFLLGLGTLALAMPSSAQPPAKVQQVVDAAHQQSRTLKEGKNADYIPALAKVDPDLFGIPLVTPSAADDRITETPSKPAVDVTAVTMAAFVPVARAGNGGFSGPALRRGLIVSFGALQALDAHSTLKALKNGGREANPVMSAIASNGAALFAVKAGTVAATAYFAERLSKNHPKGAVVLMAVLNSAYVAVVAHNYRVARR